MSPPTHAHSRPILFLFLNLPFGISGGFISVTLPFLITQAGLSVAFAGSVVAIGMASNIWRFLWAPLADLTLTLRKWYALGLILSAVSLLAVSLIPIRQDQAVLLSALVFISQVAATLISLPISGMIAHTVLENQKGRACGWYQAANVGGAGIGGGLGVWLANHYSAPMAGAVICALMLASSFALPSVPDIRAGNELLRDRLRWIKTEFRQMVSSRLIILTALLCASPIGVGAASNLWSAMAPGWKASPDTVALTSGLLSGIASALGSLFGGWFADRTSGWKSYFLSGLLTALVALAIAAAPRTSIVFAIGVVLYAFSYGMAYAAFSAICFIAIGGGAASTKYAIMASLGNLPVVYMTAFNGWMHDSMGATIMLIAEAALGILCILIGLLAVARQTHNAKSSTLPTST